MFEILFEIDVKFKNEMINKLFYFIKFIKLYLILPNCNEGI